jgi:hypothetical protein
MKGKWFDRPGDRIWEYTNADFLYMVALGQALVIQKKQDSRADKSANKVSNNFWDNILWFKSMSDFETIDISSYVELSSAINENNVELKDLQDEISNEWLEVWLNEESSDAGADVSIDISTDANNDGSQITEVEGNLPNTVDEQVKVEEIKEIEKIGAREFPKVKDIYQDGNNEYLFDMNDIKARWLEDKVDYIIPMYASLKLDENLSGSSQAKDLKELLIRPWFQQLDKVVEEMETWIEIDGQLYLFTPDQIKEAITKKGFTQTITQWDKSYDLVFDTWTPEMKKINNSVHPLWDKEYKKTEWEAGSIKEKYQIKSQWIIYKWVKWVFNNKIIENVQVSGGRSLSEVKE